MVTEELFDIFLQEKNIGKFSDVHLLKICFLQKIKQSLPL